MSRCGSVGCLFVNLGVSVTRYNVRVHVFLRCMRVRKKCGVFFQMGGAQCKFWSFFACLFVQHNSFSKLI